MEPELGARIAYQPSPGLQTLLARTSHQRRPAAVGEPCEQGGGRAPRGGPREPAGAGFSRNRWGRCKRSPAAPSCPQSAGTLQSESEIRETLRFLPQLEMRPSSNAPAPSFLYPALNLDW